MNDETPKIEQPKEQPTGPPAGGAPPGEPPPDVPQAGPEAELPRPRRLRRASRDRMIFGVAGGLGHYFGVDPVLFRIAFGVSVLFGGIGVLAYALLALFVPTDGEPDFPQRFGRRMRERGVLRALGILILALLALGALGVLATGSAIAVAVGWGVPMAVAIIVIGAILCLVAFRGGARWLILPAVALALGAGVAAAADLDFRGGIGDREHNPVSASAIPADGYRLGIGRLVVDLRGLDWSKGRVVPLRVDLGTGQANVFVPENVCVTGKTHVGVGESEVAGDRNDGFDVDNTVGRGSAATPRLELDANVDIGQLRVINSNTATVDRPGYGPGALHEDTAPLRAAETKACAVR